MKRTLYVASMFLLTVMISCSKSNESDLDPDPVGNNTCNTADMTFSTHIKPILQSNCYSCHSNANSGTSGGVKLEDYADVKHHADDGDLLGAITHAPGFPAMPQDGAKLSDCNINKIKAWVDSGAPNN